MAIGYQEPFYQGEDGVWRSAKEILSGSAGVAPSGGVRLNVGGRWQTPPLEPVGVKGGREAYREPGGAVISYDPANDQFFEWGTVDTGEERYTDWKPWNNGNGPMKQVTGEGGRVDLVPSQGWESFANQWHDHKRAVWEPEIQKWNAKAGGNFGLELLKFAGTAAGGLGAVNALGSVATNGLMPTLTAMGNSITNLPTTISNGVSSVSDWISGLGSGTDAVADFSGGFDIYGDVFSGGAPANMAGFTGNDPTDFLFRDPVNVDYMGPTGGNEFLTDPTGANTTAATNAARASMGLPPIGQTLNLANSAGGFVPTSTAMGGSIPSSVLGAGGSAAGGTALSRILNDTATAADYLSVLGNVGAAGIGAYAANQQADAMRELGAAEDARIREFMAYGAPSRERYEASFRPGFKPADMPGFQGAIDATMDSMLRKLSTQGNPFGSPGGLVEANTYVTDRVALPALERYRTQNANTGGYAGFNTAAAQGPDLRPATSAITADANTYNALGYGASQIFNPRSSMDDLISRLGNRP